jgi:transcriptional regulator with XRE-family HTH domain
VIQKKYNADLDNDFEKLSQLYAKKLVTKVGATLNGAFKDKDLTKTDLAQQAGMTRASVTKILQGQQLPQLPALYILCDILGIEVTEVLPSLKEIKPQTEIDIKLPDEVKAFLPKKTLHAVEGTIEP